MTLSALTLYEPYASLCLGAIPGVPIKDVENRPRPLAGPFPRTLAIHAGKTSWTDAMDKWPLPTRIVDAIKHWEKFVFPNFRYGCILGTVEVWGCHALTDRGYACDLADSISYYPAISQWASGPYCYLLRNPLVLAAPIPCRGRQGLFTVEIPDGAEWKERGNVE